MNKITGYYIDPANNVAEARTIDKSLEGYYALLQCDSIDILSRMIGNRRFRIIADDEGLQKAPAFVSAFDCEGSPMIVGPIFVINGNERVANLSSDELDYLTSHTEKGWAIINGRIHIARVLIGLDY